MCRKPKSGHEAEDRRRRRSMMRTRFVAIFSFICCSVSLVITFLCLFSRSESAYMWNSPVLSINTTLVGYSLLQTLSANSTQPRSIQSTPDSNNEANPVTALVNASALRISSTNTAADIQSAELGIQQWYNLNTLSICEGRYSPSADIPGAKFGPGSCTSLALMGHLQLTAHLQKELKSGKLNATLSDIGWPLVMQQKLDWVNKYLQAAFILYIFSIIFLLSAIMPSAITMFLTSTYQPISPKICLLSVISFLLVISSAATITAFSHKTASILNSLASPIGISASQGRHFLTTSWTNVAIMALISIIWAVEVCLERREGVREAMRLHQEHYERAWIWGKIGVLESEEPMCSCVDPWKVLAEPRYCGQDEGKGGIGTEEAEMERPRCEDGDPWVGVEEKVLVLGK